MGASALPLVGAGAAAREFKVKVRVKDAASEGLRPGLTGDAEILVGEAKDALAVPLQAVVLRGEAGRERPGVFVGDGKAARFVPVETGMIGGLEIEVKKGLEEGREIVAGPWQSLKDLQDGAAIRHGPEVAGAAGLNQEEAAWTPGSASSSRASLSTIREQGLFKEEWPILGEQGPEIRVEGRAEPVLNFCANNYLGLSSHPELLKAAHRALDEWGYGMSSVRFICGTQALHLELEKRIAAFLGMEDAILYAACFDANGGVFEPLLGAGRRDRHRPAQPRLDHRRGAPVQGEALRLRERRHGRPRGEARGGAGPAASA